jgi:hypothetical protein
MEIVDLKGLHTQVWETRKKIKMNFASPQPDDALRFAVTEAAEVLDAVLRQNPIYTRNHVKVVEMEREVAQVVVMLMTALEEDFDWDNERLGKSWPYWATGYKTAVGNGYRGTAVDWVVSLTADALQEQLWSQAKQEWEDPWQGEFCILQALVAMGDTGVDVGAAVERELKQMEDKYGSVQT